MEDYNEDKSYLHRYQIKEELKHMFAGGHTLFTVLGFVVGGSLVARALWEYLSLQVGKPITAFIGIIIFAISGIVLKQFNK